MRYEYIAGGKCFFTLDEAIAYANFIARVSGIFVAVERVQK